MNRRNLLKVLGAGIAGAVAWDYYDDEGSSSGDGGQGQGHGSKDGQSEPDYYSPGMLNDDPIEYNGETLTVQGYLEYEGNIGWKYDQLDDDEFFDDMWEEIPTYQLRDEPDADPDGSMTLIFEEENGFFAEGKPEDPFTLEPGEQYPGDGRQPHEVRFEASMKRRERKYDDSREYVLAVKDVIGEV
jgi:hypothetical protein